MVNTIERLELFYPVQRKSRIRLSFPARIMIYVVAVLLIINLLVFYAAMHVQLAVVLATWLIEVLALGAAVAFWAKLHRMKW